MSIILTTPCMPAGRGYHCGNALSQVASDTLATFARLNSPSDPVFFVAHAWNVHGRPFEALYEQQHGEESKTYERLLAFTQPYVQAALVQKEAFAHYTHPDTLEYSDATLESREFAIQAFQTLAEKGYVFARGGICFLDLAKFLAHKHPAWLEAMASLVIKPAWCRANLLNQGTTLTDGYPLTKARLFTPAVHFQGQTYTLSPIFQSWIYPALMATRVKEALPTLLQVSAWGHGMLKWHFLRSVVCFLLYDTLPFRQLVMHGTLKGADGAPMSKHADTIIQPTDLLAIEPDPVFARYTLLKSFSEKDGPLQLEPAQRDYRRIREKLRLLATRQCLIENAPEIDTFINTSWAFLAQRALTPAFEQVYLALKKARLLPGPVLLSEDSRLWQAYCVFLRPER